MRKRHLMMPLAGLALTAGALLSAGISARPASAAASSGCPASKTGLATDNLVSASVSTPPGSNVSTYQFSSLKDESPVGGVPGLMKYCVYPTPNAQPKVTVDPALQGDNGVKWIVGTGSNNFAFVRPGGNPSDIGLRNQDVTMGIATWKAGAVPTGQAIVLHVNDPSVCASLYAGSTSPTCFVLPGPPRGPVCDKGDGPNIAAYNANPTDVVDCLNPATGFEATSTNEFGDRVTLETATPASPSDVTLKVDFQSFACGDSGHWSGTTQDALNALSPCVTTPGETFKVPGGVTAKLYDPNGVGGLTQIATVNINPDILFRPSADSVNNGTHCAGALGAVDASNKWFNPNGIPGHQCQNSIGQLLTFDFGAMPNLPKDVVWTVAFNTSHSGYAPIGENTPCEMLLQTSDQNPGCGYDSLNVGDHTFPAAPFAGTDPNVFEVYASQGGPSAPLQATTSYFLPDPNSYRPLGEIIAH